MEQKICNLKNYNYSFVIFCQWSYFLWMFHAKKYSGTSSPDIETLINAIMISVIGGEIHKVIIPHGVLPALK